MARVLMFGWEFPPFNSGGLGVACEGLVKALSKKGTQVVFVLPKKVDSCPPFCKMVFAGDEKMVEIKNFNSLLSPYINFASYENLIKKIKGNGIYGPNLISEVLRYAKEAEKIAITENFDVIHAHDWLSFPAGIAAKKISGKPLVVHVHATEFDRTGGIGLNQNVYDIEREGMWAADLIIAVSNFTKNKIVQHYGINSAKVRVAHNAIECEDISGMAKNIFGLKKAGKKVVIFVGRITIQKGPDYFLKAAKKVVEKDKNVIFLVVGSGDMERQMIEEAANLGISDKVLFTGFLRGSEKDDIYQMADLYVLPSVSEPFGLTVLESLACGTPVLISKQSGVSEVVKHCLKVDFWDIDQMADKILAVVRHPELYSSLKEHGLKEARGFSWQDSAQKCIDIYNELLAVA